MTDEMDKYVDEIEALEPGDRSGIRHILFRVLKLGMSKGIDMAVEISNKIIPAKDPEE